MLKFYRGKKEGKKIFPPLNVIESEGEIGQIIDKETSDYNKWREVYKEALENVKIFYTAAK